MVDQLLHHASLQPRRRRPQRAVWEPAAADDRQLGQPADAADRRQPLRCQTVRRGAKSRAAVDRCQRPYAGTYASLGCGVYPVPVPMPVLESRCISCHGKGKGGLEMDGYRVEAACNLDRPEKSLLVRAPLAKAAGGLGICQGVVFADTGDADYQKLVAAIQAGGRQLAEGKRFDMPGFRPNRYYIREMKRFGFLPQDLPPDAPIDCYATDEAYWRSFWWQPVRAGAE